MWINTAIDKVSSELSCSQLVLMKTIGFYYHWQVLSQDEGQDMALIYSRIPSSQTTHLEKLRVAPTTLYYVPGQWFLPT